MQILRHRQIAMTMEVYRVRIAPAPARASRGCPFSGLPGVRFDSKALADLDHLRSRVLAGFQVAKPRLPVPGLRGDGADRAPHV
jgi:hypothetical protein